MVTDTALRKKSLSLSLVPGCQADDVFRLRYDVFNRELGEGLPESRDTARDVDRFDEFCEHLCVRDSQSNQVVGTYRLLTRTRAVASTGFYSQSEFKLDAIYAMAEESAEIGRSCVHRDYRDGSVISLLWAGLAAFMKSRNVRYLMGCGSVHTTNPSEISRIYAYVRAQRGIESRVIIEPLAHLSVANFEPDLLVEDASTLRKGVPPLIKGYLRAGAKICGHPAIDPVFNTADFFLFFDRAEIESRYGKHFLGRDLHV
ncbi:MAG: GNAT family N-acetyltransferase [Leptospirales bacterium]|nr:GNAT family N-acetyltransferase [Leptospirales bacterium]